MQNSCLHAPFTFWDVSNPPARRILSHRLALAILVALLLLLTAIAATRMNAPLWSDEYRSLFNVGADKAQPYSPGQILTRIASLNAWQGPAYYLLLSGWGALTGWSEFTTRALSLFLGLMAICWTFRFGSDAFGRRVGLLAALTLGLSGFYVHFLHEMRAYTLVALLTVVMLDSYWRLVYRGGGRLSMTLFALSVAGLPYSHYFAVAAPLALGLYHLLFAPRNRRWLLAPALMGLALLAFLPWLNVTLKAIEWASQDTRRFMAFSPGEFLTRMLVQFGNESPAFLGLLLVFSATARRRASTFVSFMLVAGSAIMIGLDNFVHILVELKYAMPLLPLVALAAALGIDQLRRRGVAVWVLAGLWFAGGLWSIYNPAFEEMITPSIWRFPWPQAVESLMLRGHPDDAVLFLMPDPSLLEKTYEPVMDYYFRGLPLDPSVIAPSPNTTDERYFELAVNGAGDADRVWLVVDKTRAPWRDGLLKTDVLPQAGFVDCGEVDAAPPIGLTLFMRPPEPDDDMQPVAKYDGITVYNNGFPAKMDHSVLPVALGFASTIVSDDYSFALHVMDASGNLVAQYDHGLPTAAFACASADVPISHLARAGYSLRLVVYNWQTGARLIDDAGDDQANLGTFVVGE